MDYTTETGDGMMMNTMMGMKGRFLCNIKSGNLHFRCIYYWCSSQKAHKHFNIFHLKHKAVLTPKLSHPSLPGPSPIDSKEWYHDKSVGLHDTILFWHMDCCPLLPISPDLGPSSAHAYQSITDMVHVNMGQLCSRSTKVFSQISVSPCCRDTCL